MTRHPSLQGLVPSKPQTTLHQGVNTVETQECTTFSTFPRGIRENGNTEDGTLLCRSSMFWSGLWFRHPRNWNLKERRSWDSSCKGNKYSMCLTPQNNIVTITWFCWWKWFSFNRDRIFRLFIEDKRLNYIWSLLYINNQSFYKLYYHLRKRSTST